MVPHDHRPLTHPMDAPHSRLPRMRTTRDPFPTAGHIKAVDYLLDQGADTRECTQMVGPDPMLFVYLETSRRLSKRVLSLQVPKVPNTVNFVVTVSPHLFSRDC